MKRVKQAFDPRRDPESGQDISLTVFRSGTTCSVEQRVSGARAEPSHAGISELLMPRRPDFAGRFGVVKLAKLLPSGSRAMMLLCAHAPPSPHRGHCLAAHAPRLRVVIRAVAQGNRGPEEGSRGAEGIAGGDAAEPGRNSRVLESRDGRALWVTAARRDRRCQSTAHRRTARPRRPSPSSRSRIITVRSAVAIFSRRSLSSTRTTSTPARCVTCFCTIPSTSCIPTRSARTRRQAAPADQGKFWDLHAKLFEAPARTIDQLVPLGQSVGLNVDAFRTCLESGKHAQEVKESVARIQKMGISGTPAFLIGRTPSGMSR